MKRNFFFTLSLLLMLGGFSRLSAQVATSDASSSNQLPTLVMSFTGQINGSAAQLTWVMENETDSKYFVVEKSGDGNEFDSIGVVQGQNNAYSIAYQYMDTHLLNGANYYRFRQVNMDGSIFYSKVISVDNSVVIAKMEVYPNPAVSMLNYTITSISSDQVVVQVYNPAGIMVTTGIQQLSTGVNQQSIVIGDLKAGNYFLKISNRQGTLRYVQAFAKI